MKLLVDNNIAPAIAEAVNVLVKSDGHEVISLRTKFGRGDVADTEWIVSLAEEGGWSVLSGDIRITKRKAEKEAWRASKLKGFFLAPGWADYNNIERSWRLLRWWPKLVEAEQLVGPGAIFQLPVNASSKLHQLNY